MHVNSTLTIININITVGTLIVQGEMIEDVVNRVKSWHKQVWSVKAFCESCCRKVV